MPHRRSSTRNGQTSSAGNTVFYVAGGILAGLVVIAAIGYAVFRSLNSGMNDSGGLVDNSESDAPTTGISAKAPPAQTLMTPSDAENRVAATATSDSPSVPANARPVGNLLGKTAAESTSSGTADTAQSSSSAGSEEAEAEFTSWADLNDRIEPSVVRIDVKTSGGRGIGSGFVADASGVIVTNYHVIAACNAATVVFANNDEFPVKGYLHLNHKKDIALLKIEPSAGSTPLRPLALFSGTPRKGSEVAAFGTPQGLSFSFSKSTVSAYRSAKDLHDSIGFPNDQGYWVQHSVPISPGSSGGPLVNREGQVIAINTVTLTTGQALNFGISSNDISEACANQTALVALSPAAAPEHSQPRRGSAPGEVGDNPYIDPDANLPDETKTEKGREMLAKMEVMNYLLLAFEYDRQRAVSGKVIELLRKHLKSADIDYDKLAEQPIMVVVLTVEPLGEKSALWMRAMIFAEDSSGVPCRIWEQRKDVGLLSTESLLFRGSIPREIERGIDRFFRGMKDDIQSSRKDLSIKSANDGSAETDSSESR